MNDATLNQAIHGIRAASFPYDQWHDWYQEYYLTALRQYLGGARKVQVYPGPLRRLILGSLKEARHLTRVQRMLGPLVSIANPLLDVSAALLGARKLDKNDGTGTYRFHLRGTGSKEVVVGIDSRDSGEIPDQQQRYDIYLKCNYWPDKNYSHSVLPFYNCNPIVLRHLDFLRDARRSPKEFDSCFVVRVWGGRNEKEGVEHCMRMLEAFARLPGNNYLLGYLVAGDIPALEKRLRRLGVRSTTKPIPPRELWSIAARSRVNVIRLGMFHCIPWRMTDLLAMGSCIVLDQHPKTVWPERLIENGHYASLDLQTSDEQPIAASEEYERAADCLASVSADEKLVAHIADSTAEYFDAHLTPTSVGRHICETVLARAG